MSFDMYTKTVLTVIAGLLALLVLRPIATPIPAQAQSDHPNLYIEPGYTALRKPDGTAQLKGKVVIDRKTGDIWASRRWSTSLIRWIRPARTLRCRNRCISASSISRE